MWTLVENIKHILKASVFISFKAVHETSPPSFLYVIKCWILLSRGHRLTFLLANHPPLWSWSKFPKGRS